MEETELEIWIRQKMQKWTVHEDVNAELATFRSDYEHEIE